MIWLIFSFLFLKLMSVPAVGLSGEPGHLHAGNDTTGVVLELITSFSAVSDRFYTDHLDNVYFIDGHRITRITVTTGRELEYGSLPAGPVTSADVSNPMQLLLFYRDFNRAVFLDNNLSPLRSAVNFSGLGIEQATLACTSGRGGIWVFSDREHRLVYFDQQFRNTHRSIIVSSVTGSGDQPVYMTESQGRLFLFIPRKGIHLFDRYASYLGTIDYKGPHRFQVLGNRIVWFEDGRLAGKDIASGEVSLFNLPGGMVIDDARLQPDRLYILSGDLMKVYRIRWETGQN